MFYFFFNAVAKGDAIFSTFLRAPLNRFALVLLSALLQFLFDNYGNYFFFLNLVAIFSSFPSQLNLLRHYLFDDHIAFY